MAFVVVLFKWIFGIDVFEWINNLTGFFWLYQFLGSMAIALVVVWFVKLFPDRKMEEASKFLDQIISFQQEENH